MTSILEKGGGTFEGIKLLLCENPLPPVEEAIVAAQAEVPRSNYYTEPFSEPLRRFITDSIGVPQRLVHINAGSELILRQIFDRLGWPPVSGNAAFSSNPSATRSSTQASCA